MKKTFAELFKKYRLRAEFEKLSELGDALVEKGMYYEDSIFSHWQKGNRVPHERKVIYRLIEIFIERKAISSIDQVNEFLESTGQGFLTKDELALLPTILNRQTIFQVPTEVPDFIGREEIIDSIVKNATQEKVIHIYGTAGVGKTSIAIKAAHVLRSEFSDGIFWYRMDTCTIKDVFVSIHHLLKVELPSSKNLEVLASATRSLLSQRRVLLILDNVESKNDMYLLLPITSSSIIILSRYKNLYIPANTTQIYLRSFTPNEALSLFTTVLDKVYVKKYQTQLLQLSNIAGNLPLAITIFAKQLSQSKIDPQELLHTVERKEISLPDFSYENKNLFVAIQISYNHLSPKAQSVFLSLGVFEGRDFSIESIAQINDLSVERTRVLLEELLNNSLIEESLHDKFRIHPMIKKFISEKLHNPYIFTLIKITGVLFIIFTVFWMILQTIGSFHDINHRIFTQSYFIVALWGGLLGLYVSQKWGGLKSLMGKAILLFSLGLLAQTFGQLAYSLDTDLQHIYSPYASLGDIGYFGTVPIYIYATVLLAKASGTKIHFFNIKKNIKLLLILSIIMIICFALLLQHYIFNWENPIKIFLDFAYPLGDMMYVYFAFLTYVQLKNSKEAIIRNKIFLICLALSMQFMTDYVYTYQVNLQTWQAGGIDDYLCIISYLLMTLAILQLNSYRFKLIRK
ncbi:MAG TPA: NB-ARC domain-containing protein [Candidatus Saccharimonadales bacterium]|nr:NB-ARC domain-containing protein [Candidatus Saccharimonadales bacterium]